MRTVQGATNSLEMFARKDVNEFIQSMVERFEFDEKALRQLFSQVKIDEQKSITKAKVTPNPWYLYERIYLNEERILNGVLFWNKYENELRVLENKFGVPANIIVATIGVETNYGTNKGLKSVLSTLINLAFSSRRTAFYKNELKEFLLLTRELHLDPLKVLGSASGAIGQPQFMPSSYRYYAIAYNDNRSNEIDLTNNVLDIMSSIANYYYKNGWKVNEPIAIPFSKVGGRYEYSFSYPKSISLKELVDLGMVANVNVLNNKNNRLISLQKNYLKENWIVFNNFEVIRRYNHSDFYAMSVFQLSYYIKSLRGI